MTYITTEAIDGPGYKRWYEANEQGWYGDILTEVDADWDSRYFDPDHGEEMICCKWGSSGACLPVRFLARDWRDLPWRYALSCLFPPRFRRIISLRQSLRFFDTRARWRRGLHRHDMDANYPSWRQQVHAVQYERERSRRAHLYWRKK